MAFNVYSFLINSMLIQNCLMPIQFKDIRFEYVRSQEHIFKVYSSALIKLQNLQIALPFYIYFQENNALTYCWPIPYI